MKKGWIAALVAVVVVAVVAAVFLLNGGKDPAKDAAQNALTKLFSCTQQSMDEFDEFLAGENVDDAALVEYFGQKYPDLMTQKGFEKALSNRLFTRVYQASKDAGADFVVKSVTLSDRAGETDGRQYNFEVAMQDESHSVTGVVLLVEEQGKWLVDVLTVDSLK